jgi:hypothetical protein
MPTPGQAAATTTVPPVSVASDLPVITPPAGGVTSSPIANIQAIPVPSSSGPPPGSFSLTIGMSASTAQNLAAIVLGLIVVLAATRLVSNRRRRTRPASTGAAPASAGLGSADPGSADPGSAGPAGKPKSGLWRPRRRPAKQR